MIRITYVKAIKRKIHTIVSWRNRKSLKSESQHDSGAYCEGEKHVRENVPIDGYPSSLVFILEWTKMTFGTRVA